MSFNIISLMWLRTVMNYQYRYGTSFNQTIKILYNQGGVKRFYYGITFAFLEAPMIKFFDTFSNSFILEITSKYKVPIFLKTIICSLFASGVKVLAAPLDTFKTMYQVEGNKAPLIIKSKINQYGYRCLFDGASATILSGFISHYPWFVTHNYLEMIIPKFPEKNQSKNLLRNAFIGFASSTVASVASNFIRVVKTTRQISLKDKSYIQVTEKIINKSGIQGLLFRGLWVRLASNGIQGLCFNVLWKQLQKKSH